MTEYSASIMFNLPTSDEIDAVTAAGLLAERLSTDEPEFRVTYLLVHEVESGVL